MTHMGAWVDLQAASTLPNLKKKQTNKHQPHHKALVSPSAMIQSFHQATESAALLWKGLQTEKLFCCQREIFLVASLWEIAVIGEKGRLNSSLQLKY